MESNSCIVTALAFDHVTRDWTKPITYYARDRMEAFRYVQFNQAWFKDFRIDGVRV